VSERRGRSAAHVESGVIVIPFLRGALMPYPAKTIFPHGEPVAGDGERDEICLHDSPVVTTAGLYRQPVKRAGRIHTRNSRKIKNISLAPGAKRSPESRKEEAMYSSAAATPRSARQAAAKASEAR